MFNGILLNFVKRSEDDLRVIFDQWPKVHLGLDALSNQKILKGVYYLLNHEKRKKKSQFCNAYVHDKVLYCVLYANMISTLEF